MNRSCVAATVAVVSLWCLPALTSAQSPHRHGSNELVNEVARAIQPFAQTSAATAAGYGPFLGCVSGAQEGAMGIHYVNGSYVEDGEVDLTRPEALMYEPRNGRLVLVGAEYIVLAEQWNATHETPPTLMGQLFHYNSSPNRYGIPAFYELHVWALKNNPNGAFADWNPRVSCEDFKPER
jgi:hypothetical protein